MSSLQLPPLPGGGSQRAEPAVTLHGQPLDTSLVKPLMLPKTTFFSPARSEVADPGCRADNSSPQPPTARFSPMRAISAGAPPPNLGVFSPLGSPAPAPAPGGAAAVYRSRQQMSDSLNSLVHNRTYVTPVADGTVTDLALTPTLYRSAANMMAQKLAASAAERRMHTQTTEEQIRYRTGMYTQELAAAPVPAPAPVVASSPAPVAAPVPAPALKTATPKVAVPKAAAPKGKAPARRDDKKILATHVPQFENVQMPDYDNMSVPAKAAYLAYFETQFDVLQREWPNIQLPTVSATSDLKIVHAQYNVFRRQHAINAKVEFYRLIFSGAFIAIETFMTYQGYKIFKNFATEQNKIIHRYDAALAEMVEDSFDATSYNGVNHRVKSSYSIEARLCFLLLINVVSFVIIKVAASYLDADMVKDFIENFYDQVMGPVKAPPTVTVNNDATEDSTVLVMPPSIEPTDTQFNRSLRTAVRQGPKFINMIMDGGTAKKEAEPTRHATHLRKPVVAHPLSAAHTAPNLGAAEPLYDV